MVHHVFLSEILKTNLTFVHAWLSTYAFVFLVVFKHIFTNEIRELAPGARAFHLSVLAFKVFMNFKAV